MNDVQSLIDRQLGLPCRYGYDSVVRRLVVRETEWWHALGAPAPGAGADDPPIFACRFAEVPGFYHILALANEDGRVAIQDTSKTSNEGSMEGLEGFQCHNNAVFDLAWMPGAMNFVTVSGDHTACLWDLGEGGAPRRVAVYGAHTRSVKTVAFRPEPGAPAFATGARDGAVLLWDARAPSAAPTAAALRPHNALAACHSPAPRTPAAGAGKRARLDAPRPGSVTGLVFQDEHTLISCGECDGNIKVWDLRKNYSAFTREPLPKHSIPYCGSSARNGYTSLVVDAARVRLYASCMDHVIYCFSLATAGAAYGASARPERRLRGHEAATFYIKAALSPDGRYLASGSSDAFAYVWDVGGALPLARLAGHRAEVTCVAWARAPAPVPALATAGDDARHMLWRVGTEADDPLRLCGRAEPAPRPAPEPEPWGAARARAERTPASARRPPPARRTKRCLTDLLNAARDREPSPKRPRADDPPSAALLPAGTKRPRPSPPLAAAPASPKRSCLEDAAARRAGLLTPPKAASPPAAREPLSPRSPNTLPCPCPPGSPQSPRGGRVAAWFAAALPDYVATGEAPHLRLMSPVKRKLDPAPDWLTLLTREKRARLSPSAPATAPAPALCSPKENAPPRRGSVSERTPKAARNSLLKYFSVASKDKLF